MIGATLLDRPDLAKAASPITYIDKNDPPFLIFYGEKDNIVSNKQSKLFSAWLKYYGVKVAAGAVVTKDVPATTVVADVPAKVIKILPWMDYL